MKRKIFYRYVPIKIRRRGQVLNNSDEINEQSLKILTDNSFHFSYPYKFNDPFDCRIFCKYEGSKEEWRKYTDSIEDINKKKEFINSLESVNYDPQKIDEMFHYVNNYQRYPYIICCFSELRDNILMWSHYASKHYGFCVGFKSIYEKGNNYFEMAENVGHFNNSNKALLNEVQYHFDSPNIINPVKSKIYSVESFQLTKSKSWKYEREYRILIRSKSFNNSDNKYSKLNFKFKKEILNEVIFGIKMEYEDMKMISNIITTNYINNGINVKLYKAKIKRLSYGLEFEPFDEKKPLKYV